ncbi:unnamed protein product [Clonostachys rhizophaga]|uniref:Uncharacterized protein n=1 Tax=Clonostachys rhizophaga TaxID=160324 RepID=A0A9N9VE26_9HYPO|nr:unnamed protein product [Clonostachys rhizophaga]
MAHVVKLPEYPAQGNGSFTLAKAICKSWVKIFEDTLRSRQHSQLDTLFVNDAWIRDFLAFSWDFRTVQGRDALCSYITSNHDTSVWRIHVCEQGTHRPTFKTPSPGIHWVETMFGFETAVGRGRGMLRLVLNSEIWKCYLINFTLEELKGHEEQVGLNRPIGYVDAAGGNWQQRRDQQRDFKTEEPTVFIVGAGQAGLTIAARLAQIGVSSLIIERSGRVGDSWRKCYKTLYTHDPIQYCHLPYIPFPAHWPYFMPKDKLADWLESYSILMELNVWCSTKLQTAQFDETSGSWTITVQRGDGTIRTMKPNHVVMATGNVGDAIVPQIPGQDQFQGHLYHGSVHTDASSHPDLSNKKVVVVGSGNSAHDICQNFYESGAGSVTMLQRGGAYVLTADKTLPMLHTGAYEEGGPPIEDCDLAGQSMPIPIQFAFNVFGCRDISRVDKDTLEGLARAGFQLDYGEDGSGIYRKYITRGGGYYIDIGCSQLIIDGKVKLKACPGGIASLSSKGLALADGSDLEAGIIVLATGYETMHSTARRLFGEKVAHSLGEVWDLDEEGEVNSWTPKLLVHGR